MDKNSYLIDLAESDITQFGRIDFGDQSQEQQVFSAIWALESALIMVASSNSSRTQIQTLPHLRRPRCVQSARLGSQAAPVLLVITMAQVPGMFAWPTVALLFVVANDLLRVSKRAYRETGVRVPHHDAELFVRGSADAGLLRIVR